MYPQHPYEGKTFKEIFEENIPRANANEMYECYELHFREYYAAGYYHGYNKAFDEIISMLEDNLLKCNDRVPKTFYPSEKYSNAIKKIKVMRKGGQLCQQITVFVF